MNIITMNFGPEALPDAGAIAQAADMLAQHQRSGNALIVVVSALPGVSEMLQESIDLSSYARAHNKLLSIHTSAARKLVQEARDRALLIQDVTDILETYNWMGRSMVNRSATPPEAAAVLAVGERLSARLLAGHLQNRGVQVVHAGEMIVTDDEYCAATPDEAGTRQRSADKLMPLLAEGYIVIVGNGSGTTPEGRATRLNDSYQTASLLAACAQASGLWLMTNRDGILTADPELTPAAQTVPVISADTLTDLAHYGLRLPTAAALAPAAAAQIPIFIRNVLNPSHPGTFVQMRADTVVDNVPLIVARKNIRVLTITGGEPDPAEALRELAGEHIQALVGQGEPGTLDFFLRADQLNIARLVLSRLYTHTRLETDSGRSALIALIGTDRASAAYLVRRLDTPARLVTLDGRTPHPALLVPEESIKEVVEKIHNLTLPQPK